MKLLRVKASNFKNCEDDFTIDLLAKSKKTSEDKEYELNEIAEDLFVYSTAAFVGKNASGKTTAMELLDCCYSILGNYRLENDHYHYDNVRIEIIFFHDRNVYKYVTKLKSDDNALNNKAVFVNQHIYFKRYYKSKIKTIYEDGDFEEIAIPPLFLEDIAFTAYIPCKRHTQAVYFNSDGEGANTYQILFRAMKNYDIGNDVLANIIQIFDENILSINMIDEHNYKIKYKNRVAILSDKELIHQLSSGTTKGILLYIIVVASLKCGFDLLIDEIENHFHKTLVDNIISLYKDKSVNKKGARLIFTTHYCEILDLFNRQDNIWIAKSDGEVSLTNMYEEYNVRPELLKSKQFYNNTFNTAVNYELLMDLKRKLKK